MSKAVEKLEKLADKFESKLVKKAQVSPMEDNVKTESMDTLQDWLAKSFNQSEKNKIINELYNLVDDVSTIQTTISTDGNAISAEGKINGTPNADAANILIKAMKSKGLDPKRFGKQSSFWLKYPVK